MSHDMSCQASPQATLRLSSMFMGSAVSDPQRHGFRESSRPYVGHGPYVTVIFSKRNGLISLDSLTRI
jgi:hypothetical protein